MIATSDELRRYCGIDVDDDPLINRNMSRALSSAIELVLGAVGRDIEDYLPNDARLTELVLIRGEELYTRGATSAKMSNARHELIFSLEEQLRLELRRAKAEANG